MAEAEKLAAVGRLAAGIAHEINNPLATIAGCAESLKYRLAAPLSDGDRVDTCADAGVIEEEAYRCKEILGGLLDFSRAHADHRGACDPEEIARRALRLLRHNPRVAAVRLSLECEPVPDVWANDDQLVQVLLALVLNAADAAAPGGTVAVRVGTSASGDVVFSVEDDGHGISPEIRERIFEPFFTTKPPGQGTGLGLSVAYGLVQAHSGRLDVISHPGLGARFDVVLPAHTEVPAGALS
jgi:two-component system NtrC family sensor kinase